MFGVDFVDTKNIPAGMENLRRLRKEKGYTCESLGLLAGVKKSAMSKYERGEIQPSKQVLLNISEALGCSVDYLLERTGSPEREAKKAAQPPEAYLDDEALEALDGLTPNEIKALSRIAQIMKEQRNASI